MSMPDVADFLFDDEIEAKMGNHGLTPRKVLQVLENRHIVVKNRRRRRGVFPIVGTDNGGAYITVPVEPTHDRLLWRPVTAWPSKDHERAWLDRTR